MAGPKEVVALVNAPETDVRAVVDAATKGGPSVAETIAAATAKGRQKTAEEAATVTGPVGDLRVVASEGLLTVGESKDFAQANMNWLLGEQMAGRPMPDLETQRKVRQGLADTLIGQRPGGPDMFARFMKMVPR